jgi:hypothetical protein
MRADKLTKIYYRDKLIDQALIKRSQYIIQITENRDITVLILIDEKSHREHCRESIILFATADSNSLYRIEITKQLTEIMTQ